MVVYGRRRWCWGVYVVLLYDSSCVRGVGVLGVSGGGFEWLGVCRGCCWVGGLDGVVVGGAMMDEWVCCVGVWRVGLLCRWWRVGMLLQLGEGGIVEWWWVLMGLGGMSVLPLN